MIKSTNENETSEGSNLKKKKKMNFMVNHDLILRSATQKKESIKFLILICLLPTFIGCASVKVRKAASSSVWKRCQNKIYEAQCNISSNSFSDALICRRPLLEDFAKSNDKSRWLIQHNYPNKMVN